jgi:hypothetical protein
MPNYGKRIIVDVKTGKELLEDVTENPDQRSDSEKATQLQNAYKEKRKSEYPSIDECVHAILDNELDALQVKRQAVKKKYPKENN